MKWDIPVDVKCFNCNCDLHMAKHMDVFFMNGKLVSKCPLCGFWFRVTIDSEGKLIKIEKNGVMGEITTRDMDGAKSGA